VNRFTPSPISSAWSTRMTSQWLFWPSDGTISMWLIAEVEDWSR